MTSENSTFGRYLLKRRLAAGGMGEVFVAEQTGVGDFRKSLALKLMLESLADDPKHVQLFLAEARIAARLVHPNVVQVFDAGIIDGRYFLAMELVDGVALTAVNRALRGSNRKASADVICHVARKTLDALEYVHALQGDDGRSLELVHRDVSPHNLLVSSRGEVKLSDFGIAKMRDSESLTAPGEVRGKLAYLSPEIILGASATARSDLYALGVTLYRLAALTSPFSGTESELISAVRRNIEPLANHRPDLPSAIVRAIERSMAGEPGERFATAAEMREAFPRGDPEARARELGALVEFARSRPAAAPVSIGTAPMAAPVVTADHAVGLEPTVVEPPAAVTVVSSVPTEIVPAPRRAWVWGVAALLIAVGAVGAWRAASADATDAAKLATADGKEVGADGARAVSGADAKNVDAKNAGADGLSGAKNADAKNAGADGLSGAKNADAKNAGADGLSGAKNADTKNADAKNADARNADAKNADARVASGADAKNVGADGASVVDPKNDSAKNDSAKNDSAKNDSAKNDGAKNADAKNAGAKNADAKNADAKNADAKNADPKNDGAKVASADAKNTEAATDGAKPGAKKARLSSPAFLSVQAEPWAHVEVNGKRVGQTPLGRLPLSTPSVVLRLSNPGFRTVERRLKLSAGEELKISEKLSPR